MGTQTMMSTQANRPTSRVYGWKPQLPDKRDLRYTYENRSDVMPSAFDLRDDHPSYMPDPYDQGKLGSCTANAIAAAFEYNERKAGYGSAEFMPSRLFIYYNERAMEGHTDADTGAAIRDGIKSINKKGVCDEALWPYDVSTFTQKPSAVCYKEAKKERALKYHKVDQTESAMKHALWAEGQPVVFGFTVYESFETEEVAKTGDMPMPADGEKALGGHAVMCVGFDDDDQVFIIRNSWGSEWGDEGYFRMPYAYLTDPDCANDFWLVSSITKPPACKHEEGYNEMFPPLPPPSAEEAVPADASDPDVESSASSTTPMLKLTGKWAEPEGLRCESGRAAKITWETEGNVPRVRIEYSCHSWAGMFSAWSTVVETTGNNGNYRWHVPEDLAPDTRYSLRVLSVDNSSVYCESPYFSVVTAPH